MSKARLFGYLSVLFSLLTVYAYTNIFILFAVLIFIPSFLLYTILKKPTEAIGTPLLLNLTFGWFGSILPFVVYGPSGAFAFLLSMLTAISSTISLYQFGFFWKIEDGPYDIFAFLAAVPSLVGIVLASFMAITNDLIYLMPLICPLLLLVGAIQKQRTLARYSAGINGICLLFMIPFTLNVPSWGSFFGFLIVGGVLSIYTVSRTYRWEPWRRGQFRPSTELGVAPSSIGPSEIKVVSGYEIAGEFLKLAVKVSNNGELAIMNTTVNIDIPDGFEYERDTLPSQRLGNISPESFQSAIFWLRPLRCVDDEYGGSVLYRDARDATHTVLIPRKRIVNICPMLGPTNRSDDIFKELKFGSLERTCTSFSFNGNPKTAFMLAESRLKGLEPLDWNEQYLDNNVYLGYSCYIGETKYGGGMFATEIQATGSDDSGILTLSVYSDDERILSGFFTDIMPSVREHMEILEERICPLATCPKCGADIDPTEVDESRVYRCSYCGGISRAAPWLISVRDSNLISEITSQ
ncbi:MAG: hypothetical protein RTU30_10065 [Candidatus Thorarchaeota archaeon]